MKNKSTLIFSEKSYDPNKESKKWFQYEHVYIVSAKNEAKEYVMKNTKFEWIPFYSEKEIFRKETWGIITKINEIIDSLKLKKSAYLYKASHLIEGGLAHRIADFLYAIDIFNGIFGERKIDIIYCDKCCDTIEIFALQNIAKMYNIKFYFFSSRAITMSGLKKEICEFHLLKLSLFINIKVIINTLVSILRISNQNEKNESKQKYDIGIILVSNANKHINWLINSLKNFDERLNYCIFCMQADEARKTLQQCGEKAKSIEVSFKMRYFFHNIPAYIKDFSLISKEIQHKGKFIFNKVDISDTVINFYLKSLMEEKFSNLIYEEIISDFMENNEVFLLTGDGDTNFISNQLFYYSSKKNGMKIKFYKDNTGIEIINLEGRIYEPYANIMDIRFFTKGSNYLKSLLRDGWKGEVFYLPDLVYLDSYKKYNNLEKRANEKVHFLWAPSYPVKSHYSLQSFTLDNSYIINECKDTDYKLYIKYHPNQSDLQVQEFIDTTKDTDNICFINKYEAIESYLEKVDIVITTPSTVILDAALKKKMVVCLVDSQSYHMIKHMGSGFTIITREELNIDKLAKIAMKRETLDDCYEQILKKQEDFIKQFYESDSNMSDVLCDIIDSMIQDTEK